MLGPGTSITHAAIRALADNGCTVLWCGEDATHFYAQGTGETRKAYQLLRQAELASDSVKRSQVVIRMYRFRFQESLSDDLTLPQIRGLEGVRVREAYAQASRDYGVEWKGRNYDRHNWANSDPVNRALSAANALLNGVCHAGIVSGGYSPGIGFVHTGKQLSFVYDIADLYKADLTIPLAFKTVAEGTHQVESRVRRACREAFRRVKLLENILPNIATLLDISQETLSTAEAIESDAALPTPLWDALNGDEETGVPVESWSES